MSNAKRLRLGGSLKREGKKGNRDLAKALKAFKQKCGYKHKRSLALLTKGFVAGWKASLEM